MPTPNETLETLNGVMEDVAAEIGYTATNALVDWFGGGKLYIPEEATADHVITKIIGMSAMQRLVKAYVGRRQEERALWIPTGYEREAARRDRMIAVYFGMGMGSKQIASITNMSQRKVQSLRIKLENLGVLPLILQRAGISKETA